MALEDANKFTKMMLEDEELHGRFASMSIEEGLSATKDMGLDFTLEELKEVRDTCELTLDDMEKVSIGAGVGLGGSFGKEGGIICVVVGAGWGNSNCLGKGVSNKVV